MKKLETDRPLPEETDSDNQEPRDEGVDEEERMTTLAPLKRPIELRRRLRAKAAQRAARDEVIQTVHPLQDLRLDPGQLGLVEPIPNVSVEGDPGPPLEPESSGGMHAAVFDAFSRAHGARAARWAMRFDPGAGTARPARFRAYLSSWARNWRQYQGEHGSQIAWLAIGANDAAVVGDDFDGARAYFGEGHGPRLLAAAVEVARVVEPDLEPGETPWARTVAAAAADALGGQLLDTITAAAAVKDPAMLERWRVPWCEFDVVTFWLAVPHPGRNFEDRARGLGGKLAVPRVLRVEVDLSVGSVALS